MCSVKRLLVSDETGTRRRGNLLHLDLVYLSQAEYECPLQMYKYRTYCMLVQHRKL